jgi:hypothetical protein
MACLDMMTQPTWAFSPKAETGEPSPPPLHRRSPTDWFRPVGGERQTWWCWGGTVDHGEPMGGIRVEGDSPQWPGGGEGRRQCWMMATTQTGCCRRRRCRCGRAMDLSGSSWSGGEAGGAWTMTVDGELFTEVDIGTGTSVARLQ